jgi:hypothetical protein
MVGRHIDRLKQFGRRDKVSRQIPANGFANQARQPSSPTKKPIQLNWLFLLLWHELHSALWGTPSPSQFNPSA